MCQFDRHSFDTIAQAKAFVAKIKGTCEKRTGKRAIKAAAAAQKGNRKESKSIKQGAKDKKEARGKKARSEKPQVEKGKKVKKRRKGKVQGKKRPRDDAEEDDTKTETEVPSESSKSAFKKPAANVGEELKVPKSLKAILFEAPEIKMWVRLRIGTNPAVFL